MVLFDLERMRKSEEYNKFLSQEEVSRKSGSLGQIKPILRLKDYTMKF